MICETVPDAISILVRWIWQQRTADAIRKNRVFGRHATYCRRK